MNAVGTPELTTTYDESTMKSESAASTETENADVFADAGIEMLLLALAAKGDLRERDGNVAAAVDALGKSRPIGADRLVICGLTVVKTSTQALPKRRESRSPR